MKIFSAPQIRALDAYTIQHEPISSINLMERASQAFVDWFSSKFSKERKVKIFAGIGNNGGDGLAVGRLLRGLGYHHIQIYIVRFSSKSSEDFKINAERLGEVIEIQAEQDFPPIQPSDIIIDAIFGSGLSRPISGFTASLITQINQVDAIVIAIDIASGLFCNTQNSDPYIIQADYTVSFQFPKLSFLLPQNDVYVGEWTAVDIDLSREAIENTATPYQLVTLDLIKKLIQPRPKFSHKGTFGHVLLIAGSYGKIGAAILAGKAAFICQPVVIRSYK